jgi:hypothetical protein
VPKFGVPKYAAALAEFPAMLAEVISITKEKLPLATDIQIQAFAVDLLLADYLGPEPSTKDRVLRYFKVRRSTGTFDTAFPFPPTNAFSSRSNPVLQSIPVKELEEIVIF